MFFYRIPLRQRHPHNRQSRRKTESRGCTGRSCPDIGFSGKYTLLQISLQHINLYNVRSCTILLYIAYYTKVIKMRLFTDFFSENKTVIGLHTSIHVHERLTFQLGKSLPPPPPPSSPVKVQPMLRTLYWCSCVLFCRFDVGFFCSKLVNIWVFVTTF